MIRFYSDDDIEEIIAAAGRLPDGKVKHEVPIDDPDGFRRTISRVPRRQALSERLERAAYAYPVFSELQAKPTANQIADAMADIEAVAAKLMAALHVFEVSDKDPAANLTAALLLLEVLNKGSIACMPAAFRYGTLTKWSGAGSLSDSVRGVYRLYKWARNVQARSGTTQPTPRPERRAGDEALNDLFRDFAGIWEEIFERQIKTAVGGSESPNPGEAGGPMIRFFSACLKPILKDKTPTKNAIRGRILRLFPGGQRGRDTAS